jgi:hypothetical protein
MRLLIGLVVPLLLIGCGGAASAPIDLGHGYRLVTLGPGEKVLVDGDSIFVVGPSVTEVKAEAGIITGVCKEEGVPSFRFSLNVKTGVVSKKVDQQ